MFGDLGTMQKIWPYIYLTGALAFGFIGYHSLDPARTADTNADWIFVSISFVGTCLFPLISLTICRRRGIETFQRPSFRRQPNGPLQSIRLFVASLFCYCVGSAIAIPATDHKGIMLFWFHAAMALGFFVGERLAYWVYAKRIV